MARLTTQQNYLLNRIPRLYELREEAKPEPVVVKRARAVIEAHEEKNRKRSDERERKMKQMIDDAREAVYFGSTEVALDLVKKLEAEAEK